MRKIKRNNLNQIFWNNFFKDIFIRKTDRNPLN